MVAIRLGFGSIVEQVAGVHEGVNGFYVINKVVWYAVHFFGQDGLHVRFSQHLTLESAKRERDRLKNN